MILLLAKIVCLSVVIGEDVGFGKSAVFQVGASYTFLLPFLLSWVGIQSEIFPYQRTCTGNCDTLNATEKFGDSPLELFMIRASGAGGANPFRSQ